jgi:hypothetical protein
MPYLLIILILLSACAPVKQNRLAEQSVCVPIGSEESPQDLCFLNVDNRDTYNQRSLFFIVNDFGTEMIPALGGGLEVFELLISPSRHYAAVVESAGEGHGIFFVTDLHQVRAHKNPQRCPGIEAYPYGFFDLQWHDNVLHFSTNVDLLNLSAIDPDVEPLPTYNYRLNPAQACHLEIID